MITDADIFWPVELRKFLPPLFPDHLYGFCRRVIMREDLGMYLKNQMHVVVEDIDELFLGGNYEDMATMDDLKMRLPHDALNSLRVNSLFLKIEEPETFTAMGWNSDVESTQENPLPLGYGQLYNCQVNDNWYPEDFDTAAGCDSYFSSCWPQDKRVFLKNFSVLHIGPRMIHWDGRKNLW